MDVYRPVYWSQGLFLTPQHFQQQDLHFDTRLRQAAAAASPHLWGVRRLRVRDEGLRAGVFEILDAEIVTRDGHVVRCGAESADGNAVLAPQAFDRLISGDWRRMGVYLMLPRGVSTGSNIVDDGDEAASRRHRLVEQQRTDVYEPDAHEPADVGFVEFAPRLLFDADASFAAQRAAGDCVQIAELVPADKGARLSPAYVPPSPRIDATPFVPGLLKDLRDLTLDRAEDFARLKRQRGIRGTADTLHDVMRTLIHLTLNRQIAQLRTASQRAHLHPEDAYAMLCAMVAELSTFSEEFTVLGAPTEGGTDEALPAYDHERIHFCLSEADKRIRGMLDRLSVGTDRIITFDFDGEYFHAELPDAFLEGKAAQFFLMIESPVQGEALDKILMATGKLGSRTAMTRLRSLALFGQKLGWRPVPPEELPQRSSRFSYFQVDKSDPHWNGILEENTMLLFPGNQLDPAEMKVMIVKTSSE